MKIQPIERLVIGSPEATDRVRRGVPFVSRIEWPALASWSPTYIKDRSQPKPITLFEKTRDGAKEIEVDLREYIDIVFDPTWGERYEQLGIPQTRLWFEGGPDPALGALLDDITIPPLVDQARLQSVNLWLGAGGFDNGNHYDPNGMNNLNVQVRGRKRWRVFHPQFAGVFDLTPALDSIAPPLVSSGTRHPDGCRARPGYDEVVCFETELSPGDAIFVPAFWMHWVAYGPDETINVNFWWAPESVPMTGIATGWAFVNALLAVFRRRMPGATLGEVCEALSRLAPETRELLLEIERALICEPALLASESAIGLRRGDGPLIEGFKERFRDRE